MLVNTDIYSRIFLPSDKVALLRYLAKAYPERTNLDAFIDFTLRDAPKVEAEKSLLVLKDQEIIGTNMFLQARVRIGRTEYAIIWSYGTKVLDEYRDTEAGTLICGEIFSNRNCFGAGLSSISVELHRRMHSKFIAKSVAFIKLNMNVCRYVLAPFLPLRRKLLLVDSSYPENINTRFGLFIKLNNSSELRRTQGNYWNENLIEFERSNDFFTWRFFSVKNRYQVYACHNEDKNDIYFACRQYYFHGIPFLYIVDYRFVIDNLEMQYAIVEAALHLSNYLNLAGVYIRSSLVAFSKVLKNYSFIEKAGGADIVTRFKPAILSEYQVFHTPADSDMDF